MATLAQATTRDATSDDLPALADMGVRFREVAYPTLPITRDELAVLVAGLIAAPNGFVRVLEREGEVVGMLWACISPVLPTSCVEVGKEIAWWIDPECRGGGALLMRDYDAWCDRHGVPRWASEMVGPEFAKSPAGFYERMGYAERERAWFKERG